MFSFVIFTIMLSGWLLAALCVHVVRSPSGFTIVTKNSLGINDTWADTREWTPEDLVGHTHLVRRLVALEKGDALAHVIGEDAEPRSLLAALEDPAARRLQAELIDQIRASTDPQDRSHRSSLASYR